MTFSAGELCCSLDACVLLDTNTGESVSWDKIPHVTEINVNFQANTQKITTSSTRGKETSICGTVSQTGTLSIACHKGVGPGFFAVNRIYHLMWSANCADIWDFDECEALNQRTGTYFQAYVRITQAPLPVNIAGSQVTVYQYSFDIVSWVVSPEDYSQASHVGFAVDFGC